LILVHFPDGIQAQPEALRRSAKALDDALRQLPGVTPEQVLALVGIGASEHVARSAAPVWRALGLRAFAVPAAELQHETRPAADVHVGLSESGRSAETVAALGRLTGGRRVGITNEGESPIAAVVDDLLCLDSGPDSPVYTTGYTATLQAVGMLGEHWSGTRTDWSVLPELAATVLADAVPVVEGLRDAVDAARVVDVVASGASGATAGEGALMLRESARLHTANHETYNYLHGPMEPLDARTACVVVGDGREVRLAQDTSALGCPTLLVTGRDDVRSSGSLTVLRLPPTPSPLARTVLEILPVQLLAWAVASQRGLAVDGFRYRQDDTKLD
jgi:glutamine---fructose-6-phosphate transaminase (isomerizing)